MIRARALDSYGVDTHPETEPKGDGTNSTRRTRPSSAVAVEALEHRMDALHNFARYLSGSAVEAEDLVQDTYARALGAASTFTEGTNLRSWLFRILRNAFLDGRRRARKTFAEDVDAAEEEASEQAALAREPLLGDVEMEALRGSVAQNIERALAVLTPDARAVVLLDLEGFTETEMAEVLGCAVGTVKSRLSRAREALRHLLSEYRR